MLLLISDSHRELSGSRIKKPEREERRRRRDPLFRAPIRKFFGRSFQEEPFVPLITSLIYLFNSPQEREREGFSFPASSNLSTVSKFCSTSSLSAPRRITSFHPHFFFLLPAPSRVINGKINECIMHAPLRFPFKITIRRSFRGDIGN